MKEKKRNKHGLSRDIPEDVKRQVRQKCGFGCVICGVGIFQYEHVDPLYEDAIKHDPSCITLLCPSCHAAVTSKFWSKKKVKDAMLDPACLKKGFAGYGFDFDGVSPVVTIGGVSVENTKVVLSVFNKDILRVDSPDVDGGSYRLSGLFFDDEGKRSLVIDKNEWIAFSDNWDVEVGGGKIIIRNRPGNIVLRIKVDPPKGFLIDRMKMAIGPFCFNAHNDELSVVGPGTNLMLKGCSMGECGSALVFFPYLKLL